MCLSRGLPPCYERTRPTSRSTAAVDSGGSKHSRCVVPRAAPVGRDRVGHGGAPRGGPLRVRSEQFDREPIGHRHRHGYGGGDGAAVVLRSGCRGAPERPHRLRERFRRQSGLRDRRDDEHGDRHHHRYHHTRLDRRASRREPTLCDDGRRHGWGGRDRHGHQRGYRHAVRLRVQRSTEHRRASRRDPSLRDERIRRNGHGPRHDDQHRAHLDRERGKPGHRCASGRHGRLRRVRRQLQPAGDHRYGHEHGGDVDRPGRDPSSSTPTGRRCTSAAAAG
jgi:hypothetical protein